MVEGVGNAEARKEDYCLHKILRQIVEGAEGRNAVIGVTTSADFAKTTTRGLAQSENAKSAFNVTTDL